VLVRINIPGAVVDYDTATHELLTLGFVTVLEPGESSECDTRGYRRLSRD